MNTDSNETYEPLSKGQSDFAEMYTGEFNEALSAVISFTKRRPDEISNLLKRAFDALMDKEYDRAKNILKDAAVKCYEIIWSLQHAAVRSAYDKIIRNLHMTARSTQDEIANGVRTMESLKSKYEYFIRASARTDDTHSMIEYRKRQVDAGFEIVRMAGMNMGSFEIAVTKREKRSSRIRRMIVALISAALVSTIVYIIAG
ncbi:MAG: hypothetical protein FWD37_02550 [Methanomassiliicoccaceae archaeon]|nr:hypothetical protein [Methanomassiliicoccaceae archaeon]